MTVNPGNAGQMYMSYVGKKIRRLLTLKVEMQFKLYWTVCADKILKFVPMGMDGFVLGTTLLFGRGKPMAKLLKKFIDIAKSPSHNKVKGGKP